MAWRIVRQPDGKLARWSDVVEAFTHSNMTEAEAVEVCRETLGEHAAEKVRSGVEDHEPWTTGEDGDGLSRWRDCLESMPLNRDVEAAVAQVCEMGFPEWANYVRKHAPNKEDE